MKIFLDTSSLFKLYHREDGTNELELMFSLVKVTTIFLSEITKVEFSSAVWKKVRKGDIAESDAKVTIELFESDCEKYTFVATDSIIIEQAKFLSSKYGTHGLRTLDSIQLATSISLSEQADVFFTSDNLLKSLFKIENLKTEISKS